MKLVEVSREHVYFKEIRDRHYVENHGCVGRQIHYLIFMEGQPLEQPIGIISGASAVWGCTPRDRFFGITKENRQEMIQKIIDNTIFRLELHEKNLASRILALWRRQIIKDWIERYGERPLGFETFVYGESRNGAIYKADNWQYVGETAGRARYTPDGRRGKTGRVITEPKLVFCRKV